MKKTIDDYYKMSDERNLFESFNELLIEILVYQGICKSYKDESKSTDSYAQLATEYWLIFIFALIFIPVILLVGLNERLTLFFKEYWVIQYLLFISILIIYKIRYVNDKDIEAKIEETKENEHYRDYIMGRAGLYNITTYSPFIIFILFILIYTR